MAFADSFYIGTGDDYEILLHDADGMVRRMCVASTRRSRSRQRLSMRHSNASGSPMKRVPKRVPAAPYFEAQLTWMAETPAAEHFPAYGNRFLVDAEHNLWVEQFTPERWNDDRIPAYGLRFDVFEAGGRFLGAIELPANFEPTDIGADYVLGLWEDEFEVQYALKFDLIKPESTD